MERNLFHHEERNDFARTLTSSYARWSGFALFFILKRVIDSLCCLTDNKKYYRGSKKFDYESKIFLRRRKEFRMPKDTRNVFFVGGYEASSDVHRLFKVTRGFLHTDLTINLSNL
jgi:hypothetical protein